MPNLFEFFNKDIYDSYYTDGIYHQLKRNSIKSFPGVASNIETEDGVFSLVTEDNLFNITTEN
ncbi:MAG: hypothetical protein JKY48_03360 [Flavobacteriales bacterium]|nr:hypothetical protein [Flavobacteriales bacterium]